jgi:putative ABC transport system ATP-binding protein
VGISRTVTDTGARGGSPAARARNLSKVYGGGQARVRALDGVDVAFARGEFTAIMGPSGSGKSTLMHCVAGLDTPTGGAVWVGHTEITALGDKALTELRRDRIGFIFQAFNLLPTLSAAENITLPMDISGRTPDPAWVAEVIETVGLRDRLDHRPSELSGGQQQRVACARALAGRPELIFADEPTGNLDSHAAAEVLGFLRRSVDELGQSLAMVTHDAAAAAYADRVLFLADGRIVAELTAPTPDSILETMKHLEGNPTTGARDAPPAAPRLGYRQDADPAPTSPPAARSKSTTSPSGLHMSVPVISPSPGASTDERLGAVRDTAQAAREHLDRLVADLRDLAGVTANPVADNTTPSEFESTPDVALALPEGANLELSALLAGERARRQAAELTSNRATAQLDALRVELAHTRAAATAALELAAARAEQQLSDARSAHERWQGEVDASHRDRELSVSNGRG